MAEFADNNAVADTTGMSNFFANKGFHPRMSFSPSTNQGDTARERVQSAKANDIADKMSKVLDIVKEQSRLSRKRMTKQANRCRSDVTYEIGDFVILSSTNVITARPSKKLDDKMIGPFKVIDKVGSSYRLDLPNSMKIHNVFHPSLLRKAGMDHLPGQRVQPSGPIIIDDQEEWELDDILDSRMTGQNRRLQFQVPWKDESQRDLQWYNADGDRFVNANDIINDFFERHPDKPRNLRVL